MKFPLTDQLLAEATKYELRSACRDCFFWIASPGSAGARSAAEGRRGESKEDDGTCAHDWPDEGQRRWPLDALLEDGTRPTEVAFCKEFELR